MNDPGTHPLAVEVLKSWSSGDFIAIAGSSSDAAYKRAGQRKVTVTLQLF